MPLIIIRLLRQKVFLTFTTSRARRKIFLKCSMWKVNQTAGWLSKKPSSFD
jgi:hypothetical protein